jgi:NaMN:DMB phosphoribosyltransferase
MAPLVQRPARLERVDAGALVQGPMDSVGSVALHVDAGRAAAAAAADRGATMVAVDGTTGVSWAPGGDGPLRALRLSGDAACAVAVGVAIGAGECGLRFVADGTLGAAAAAIAVGVEPALAPYVSRG